MSILETEVVFERVLSESSSVTVSVLPHAFIPKTNIKKGGKAPLKITKGGFTPL